MQHTVNDINAGSEGGSSVKGMLFLPDFRSTCLHVCAAFRTRPTFILSFSEVVEDIMSTGANLFGLGQQHITIFIL